MPPATALPVEIAALATRQAIEVSDDHWVYDTGKLVATIQIHPYPFIDRLNEPKNVAASWAFASSVITGPLLLRILNDPFIALFGSGVAFVLSWFVLREMGH